MNTTRRRFLQHAACTAAAAAATRSLPGAAPPQQLPIIDTHQHLWDLKRFPLAWVRSSPQLNRSFVTSDYLQATRGLNVVKAVYMEVNVPPELQVAEAEYVIQLCRSPEHPTAAAVISGRPESEGFRSYIMRFRDNPYIKGIRRLLHGRGTPRGYCLQPQMVRSIQLLGELGMSFDLCMRPAELEDGVKLVDRCRHTRFIVDHCGNADPKAFGAAGPEGVRRASHQAQPWRDAISRLAERDNVVCKISGIVARAPRDTWRPEHLAPIVDHCIDRFGPERVMFGGDWPVCTRVATLRQWVEALQQITARRGAELQRKLFHDNAARFYGLS